VLERTKQRQKQRFSITGSVVAFYKVFLILFYFQALSQKTSTVVDFYADARFLNPKNQKFLGTPL